MNQSEIREYLIFQGMAFLFGMPVIIAVGFFAFVLLCISVGCPK